LTLETVHIGFFVALNLACEVFRQTLLVHLVLADGQFETLHFAWLFVADSAGKLFFSLTAFFFPFEPFFGFCLFLSLLFSKFLFALLSDFSILLSFFCFFSFGLHLLVKDFSSILGHVGDLGLEVYQLNLNGPLLLDFLFILLHFLFLLLFLLLKLFLPFFFLPLLIKNLLLSFLL